MHGRHSIVMGAAAAAGDAHGVKGLRNLFGPLEAGDVYCADAASASAGEPPHRGGNPGALVLTHAVMPRLGPLLRHLNSRIERGALRFWTDRLTSPAGEPSAGEHWENPSIPSGYTYLLQLIAHDTVDSAATLARDPSPRAVLMNTRTRPLMLDTVYGGGPDALASVYELDVDVRDSGGALPRTRLRVGPKRRLPTSIVTSDCPFRDIARAAPVNAGRPGQPPVSDDSGLDQDFRRRWVTEALIADQRNDAHPLVSQMTVLFHLLHNQLMDRLVARPLTGVAPAEAAYRRFLSARGAVTLIYRNIVEKDVLSLLLHPGVYRRYGDPANRLLDPAPGIPLEFSHAAYRFGHAMVREEYRVNSNDLLQLSRGLSQSSSRTPGFVPISDQWIVDWARFFSTGTVEPNRSRRIGPAYSTAMMSTSLFPSREPGDAGGLPARDLMAACFAGIWSVPRLYARLERELAGDPIRALLPPYAAWVDRLSAWLAEPDPTGISAPLEAAEVAAIANDPPLPFFVLFEAAHSLRDGRPVAEAGGRHLGPVGSIIVAEALFGALRNEAVGVEAPGSTLRQRIATVCSGLVKDAAALEGVPEIADMPALLRFMAQGGAFSPPS